MVLDRIQLRTIAATRNGMGGFGVLKTKTKTA